MLANWHLIKIPDSPSVYLDYDECANEVDNCSTILGKCSNSPPGTFSCVCEEGYAVDVSYQRVTFYIDAVGK